MPPKTITVVKKQPLPAKVATKRISLEQHLGNHHIVGFRWLGFQLIRLGAWIADIRLSLSKEYTMNSSESDNSK